ncbi:MAG: DUF1365 domain-containing protein [Pseudomonadota bacterium]
MRPGVEHIKGTTFHGRKGPVTNAFTYGVDYLLFDAEAPMAPPWPLRRNRRGLLSLFDRDHGGAPGEGRGAEWVREVLDTYQIGHLAHRIELLAQPKVMGHVFNPVSFWLVWDEAKALRVVIAEVTNTFGDRHSYLCRNPANAPITARDRIEAKKIFFVSPFQPVEGGYTFKFHVTDRRIAIRIDYDAGENGVIATLAGPRAPATSLSLFGAMFRRPFGSRRVLTLIHWQALKLWWKGARYRSRPEPPVEEISA